MILWELLTGERPFEEFPFTQWLAQLEDSIIAGTRPTIPADCLPGRNCFSVSECPMAFCSLQTIDL